MRARWAAAAGALAMVVGIAGCGRQPILLADDDAGASSSSGDDGVRTTGPGGGDGLPDTAAATAGQATSGGVGTDDGPVATGSCCDAHPEPSCDQPNVAQCVCDLNAACCGVEWNAACAAAAIDVCGAVCGGDTVADTGAVDDGPVGTGGPGDTGMFDTGAATDSGPPPDTTGPAGTCQGIEMIELEPADAVLSGGWMLTMSMLGEGEIIVLDNGQVGGAVRYEPDLPCEDTWYIWVRYWQQGSDDSYFATLDGQPQPPAIFEGDCGNGGNGWDWAALNWRDENDPPCTYVEDPWAPAWGAGVHEIELTYRESIAVGRIIVTNDPAFTP